MDNKQKLIEYVKCIKDMEISLYGQYRAISQIKNNINHYQKHTQYEEIPYIEVKLKEKPSNDFLGNILGLMFVVFIGGIIGAIICSVLLGLFKGFITAAKGGGIAGAIVGLFIGILGWLVPDTTDKENEQIIKETNLQNEQIRTKNENNKQIALKNESFLSVLTEEYQILSKHIKYTEELLGKYYDLDIIYPKYRNLVYICSIYEYLESDRCDSLTGPYGAYNLLENDIKYARIVEKLDYISQTLEDIRDNQRELYYAIQETNNSLNSLNASLNNLSENMTKGLTELNSQVSQIEYNSKIAADSSQFVAMYSYFKN